MKKIVMNCKKLKIVWWKPTKVLSIFYLKASIFN
jgi:hypothetical protein